VTFHPVTLENSTSETQFKNLLYALSEVKDLKVILTKANSDTDGRIINKMVDDYVNENKEKAIAFTSMGQRRYLSAMKYVSVVVGNSSSGILEAPSFKIPTVNIGDRQKGRVQVESTINCNPIKKEIYESLIKALSSDFKEKIKDITSPYGNGEVSQKIFIEIKESLATGIELKKSFYDFKR